MPLRKRYLFVCQNRRADDHPKGSCAARGSEEFHAELKKELASRSMLRTEVRVCLASCLDVCSQGAVMVVEPDQIFLGQVSLSDVPAIADALEGKAPFPEHLVLSRAQIDQG
jgi:(2Fe-2S) ferredoxin